MARTIDNSKIEKIKEATLKLVVEKGIGNASISEIASMANVADGYLYRFFPGKNQMVESLLYDIINMLISKIEAPINNRSSVLDILCELSRSIFQMAIETPEKIKFLYVLMNDYKFVINDEQRKRIYALCCKIKELGIDGEFTTKEIDEETIYLLGVAYPIQFINLRLKGFFGKDKLEEKDMEKIFHIYRQLLKTE